MGRFKVGDIVVAKPNNGYTITTNGWEGEVVSYNERTGIIDVAGNDGSGRKMIFVGLAASAFEPKTESCEPERKWKIVILADGGKTLARMYKNGQVVREATVERYYKDKYDEFVAAEEAVKKLFGKRDFLPQPKPEEPKGYTGQAVYIGGKEEFGFTKGRIYKFENGKTIDDQGYERPCGMLKYRIELKPADWGFYSFVNIIE